MERKPWVELVLVILVVVVFLGKPAESKSKEEKRRLKEKTLEMFQHAYNSYMKHAYPADELMPLTCQGRTRDTKPGRGDIDDALGNFSLTLIDTLDTLAVLGFLEEFEKAVKLVISDVSFDNDIVVSVFETNIRILGGLLGAHVVALDLKKNQNVLHWYTDELLKMAKDIGYRLLPAFNTTTGIPYPRVNLKHGLCKVNSRAGHERDTCTACAGTMILEFAALSRLTGETVFEEKAHKAMEFLWEQRHRSSDLVGTVINIHNGDWVRRESGVGAGIDSYYEYLLKAYILLGDDSYLDRFNRHYSAIMQYINQGPMLVDVHMHRPDRNSRNFMDALGAFWPGLQVLKGDIKSAIEIHEMLYQVTKRHNFLPEAFTTDFRVHWGQHPLRPEFVESTYFLYKATGDPYYLEAGESVLLNLEKHARVPCGFAAIKDVTTGHHENQMDSFVLAETFKYLYLLFSEPKDLVLNVDNYVFTTEAHLLPLTLAMQNHSMNATKVTVMPQVVSDEDETYDRSCRNIHMQYQGNLQYYAQNIRKPMENYVEKLCPKPLNQRSRRLRAAEFIAGKQEHLTILTEFGIRLATLQDGRVQLLHTASDASTPEDAQEGLIFMQEMIELSKSQQTETQQEPRVVQFSSSPYNGKTWLSAGPALFGKDLKSIPTGVKGSVILADPFDGCTPFTNADEIRGRIAIVERGGCMFVDKAKQIEETGGIGGIVLDNHPDSSSSSSPLFAMSGDGKTEVDIPFLFLFRKEGQDLLDAVNKNPPLTVLLAVSPLSLDTEVENRIEPNAGTMRIKQLNDNVYVLLETLDEGDIKYEVAVQMGKFHLVLTVVPYSNKNVEEMLRITEKAEFKITPATDKDAGWHAIFDGSIPVDEDRIPDSVYINIATRKLLSAVEVEEGSEVAELLKMTKVINAYCKTMSQIVQSVLRDETDVVSEESSKLFRFLPDVMQGRNDELTSFIKSFVQDNPLSESPKGPETTVDEETKSALNDKISKYPMDFTIKAANPSMKVSLDHYYIDTVQKIIYVTQEEFDQYKQDAGMGENEVLEMSYQGSEVEGDTSEGKDDAGVEGIDPYQKLVNLIQQEMEEEDRKMKEDLEREEQIKMKEGSDSVESDHSRSNEEDIGTKSEQIVDTTAKVFHDLKVASPSLEHEHTASHAGQSEHNQEDFENDSRLKDIRGESGESIEQDGGTSRTLNKEEQKRDEL